MSDTVALQLGFVYTIMFKKIFYTNITKYKVIAKYQDADGNDKIDHICDIDRDYRTSILNFEEYITIDKYKLLLPSDIYIDNKIKFELYKNDTIIAHNLYVYNSYLNTVVFTKEFTYSDKDMIKLKYCKELILLSYTSSNSCTFYLEPEFEDKHLLGMHNILL